MWVITIKARIDQMLTALGAACNEYDRRDASHIHIQTFYELLRIARNAACAARASCRGEAVPDGVKPGLWQFVMVVGHPGFRCLEDDIPMLLDLVMLAVTDFSITGDAMLSHRLAHLQDRFVEIMSPHEVVVATFLKGGDPSKFDKRYGFTE